MFGRRTRTTDHGAVAPAGHEHCSGGGCRRRDAARCSYVDKRSRSCPTSWCSDHQSMVDDAVYCRRHASTMTALESTEAVAGLPDLDNRAPSLVGYVARDLDEPVRQLFARIAPAGATLVTDPVRLVLTPGGHTRRWAKTWKLLDHASILNRVSVEVDESDDPMVSARVDTELIGAGVPPWIENRLAGRSVDAAAAATQRREFAGAMARSIELIVTRQEVLPRY